MKRIIDISDEYYKIITEIPVHQCTADMLIIKYSIPHETVTEFADRCKECGAKYGKLLKQQSCDDAISRKELDKALYDRFHDEDSQTNMTDVSLGAIRNFVRNFPSATPQEPFMNKPCIAHQICHEDKVKVLDKIRAEIEDLTYYWCEVNPKTVIDDALQIIDKYKAESEDKK